MRTLFISLALLAVSMVAKAQNVESIFEQFRNHENVELVDVPKELLALGLKASGNKDAQKWVDKIDHLRVLSLEEATKATKKEFQKAVEAFNWKGYDEMIKVNSEGSKVRIMTQGTNEIIKRLVIYTVEDDECAFVVIDGNIASKDIDGIIESATSK
ncbi:hypothetical protein CBG57_07715 [Prevotella nigrescens]|uniref:DUF4252 domain-containing protein n=1 Tax=Prevotella nigrescens TaxID=28133 RepID=UPI000B4DB984|nr:DUF4252 domain-containing protein [Prevotella nigrescens]OWP31027.1 hypothetical protein CBG57_07715 [Prevotella nigrescens]